MPKHINLSRLEAIADALSGAREQKGLSQRALGKRVGFPQSHISKIESAAVDLQTTSLIEMARALDLEVVLIPRSLLPAVQALQRRSARDDSTIGVRESDSEPVPAYRLDDESEVS